MIHDNPAIDALLNRFHHPNYIDLSLERIEKFLVLIGDPHKKLPPVIHIAGTNGKGSLAANLHAVFETAGYTVHRYISPHLVRFNERIVVAGKEIEDDYLEDLLKRILALADQQSITFFEMATVAAFLAFSEHPADVVILEVGLGGRLDATNVVTPVVTAITPISLDHCKHLGDTIAAIAGEKAGIIKPGVPCVVGRQPQEALGVISERAAILNAPLYPMGVTWDWRMQEGKAIYASSKRNRVFAPGLAGKHQYDNAATAIACIDRLPQFNITDEAIRGGLQNVSWPARLQRLENLSPSIELWLDGGHNPQGGEVLADWLKEQGKEIYLICGMVKNKDTVGYLKSLAAVVRELYAIDIPEEEASRSAEDMLKAAQTAGIKAFVAGGIENALQSIAARAKNPAIVCICGSLYLAGHVLATNERKKQYAA